ncbi:MAG TPA: hypothetical protein VES20_01565, partial [Bryobacteraceae bacterium]|nr:hypothetical protein [Bryobacteraceae bacterium]
WNARNGELHKLIDNIPVLTFAAVFSPDGGLLATAGVDRNIYLWNARSWKLERTITGQPELISALDFSADGKRIATGGFNDIAESHPVKVMVWDAATGRRVHELQAPRAVSTVAFSPDGTQLAAASRGKLIHIWQLAE